MVWNPNYKWANPAANWQKTYQSSSWYQPRAQMPQQQMPQQMPQMPQQMPQQNMQPQYQQQQYPQISQDKLNSFFKFTQNKPISNFMIDPRYQPIAYTNTYKPSQFNPNLSNDNIAMQVLYALNKGFFGNAR